MPTKMIDDSTNTTPLPLSKFRHLDHDEVHIGSNEFILVETVGRKRKVSVKEKVDSFYPWAERKFKSICTVKNITRRLPFLQWMKTYNSEDAIGDLVAGVTVGLTVIPQSLAYANIAGLPAEYGLYGSFLGALMYIFLGSCKDVPMGPTAICSILTFQTLHGLGAEYGILLCFLSGVIQFIMGIVGLGIIIDFVSGPVSSGFTSAVAILIVSSQIKDLIGITAVGSTFIEIWSSIIKDISNIQLWDTVAGIVCIIILIGMRHMAEFRIGVEGNETPTQRFINKAIWLVATSRNCFLVIVSAVIGYYLYEDGQSPVKLIGAIPPGLPSVQLPPFSVQRGNETIGFLEMCSELGSGIIVLPIIALLENIAVCKAFANGKATDATQELIAIGLCNIGNSFVQSFPGSGSLSRSAVNNSSGVRTPLGGLYTGVLVIIALLFFTPCFFFIPKTSLAAVIIAAVVFMVEVRVVKPIWRSKKSDLIPGVVTFIACLVLRLEIGILIGIGLNLVSILYHAARPKISMEIKTSRAGVEYLLLTPDRCLIFPSVDYVSGLVTKHSIKQGIPVVIDCSHIYGADFTAAKVVEVLTKDFSRRRQPLFFFNLKSSIVSIFEGVQPKDFVVYYNENDLDNLLLNYKTQRDSIKMISGKMVR
ncbi:sodium-independent sulfate anion transporter [Halyomorpha halys]|uniref:sodium-independent sulfate anion transporter n=1 Tax=Halyomorpha halys TaxID=286706 RepID=UPI0006D4E23B|nr:sodium-independent sulfate anion transporter [Halyomorpha halys]